MIDHQLLDEVSDRTTAAILSDLLARVAALEALGAEPASRQTSPPAASARPGKGRAATEAGAGGAGARPQRG
jgi:hypothetical protein